MSLKRNRLDACDAFSSICLTRDMYNVKKMFFSAEQQQQQQHFIHISITGFVKLIE